MGESRYGFFTQVQIDSAEIANSLTNNKTLRSRLVEEIKGILAYCNQELRQPSKKLTELEEHFRKLEEDIARNERRLETLEKYESNHPVTKEEAESLIEHIQTRHKSGVKFYLNDDPEETPPNASPAA